MTCGFGTREVTRSCHSPWAVGEGEGGLAQVKLCIVFGMNPGCAEGSCPFSQVYDVDAQQNCEQVEYHLVEAAFLLSLICCFPLHLFS